MMKTDPFRDSLDTDLAKSVYDWAPVKKMELPPNIGKDIAVSFCVREDRNFVGCSFSGVGVDYVIISGESSIYLYSQWSYSFNAHGYSPPILVCEQDHIT
jgi:hypothetical protein